MQIPEFLKKSIENNTTSLGNHPAFPPEDEDTFISSLIKGMYLKVMEGVETSDKRELTKRLNELITECKKEEEPSKEALEQLCSNILAQIFSIPDDTIDIEGKLVEECDMSKYRMVPESNPDFEFEDIEEMNYLTDKIYQRRMVDCLMSGISVLYANTFEQYIQDIWKINPRLISLYNEIYKYNIALLFNQADSISGIEHENTGCVSVYISDEDDKIKIESEGVIFPILLEYSIRGILEVASLKGLPKDSEKAEYIMGKTDYRLAENWDMRLGIPLWNLIENSIEKSGFKLSDIEPNFIIMELSKLEPEIFNTYLQNVFKKTRKGIKMTEELLNVIAYNKEQDDFDNYIQANNNKYSINDDCEYYTSEELLNEIDK